MSYAAGLALLALMLPVALLGKSDTLDGVRYWWLADDAMISMRYGRNLAEGLERVMNLSENRIEMRIPQSAWFSRDLCFPHS